jgi:hypothetical protein
MTSIDHPFVRAHHACPFCARQKDAGLVACWPCFRTSGLKDCDPVAEAHLDRQEVWLRGPYREVR